jgi:hypothetical protein
MSKVSDKFAEAGGSGRIELVQDCWNLYDTLGNFSDLA